MKNSLFLLSLLLAGITASAANLTATVIKAGVGKKNGKITLAVTGGNAPYTFSWSGPSGYTASWQNPDSLGAGTYCVTVTDRFCGSAQLCVTIDEVPNSIAESALAAEASVYPNPFRDRIHVRFENPPVGSIETLLLDATGRVVNTGHFPGTSEFDWMINRSLPAGMYLLILQQSDGRSTRIPLMRSGE